MARYETKYEAYFNLHKQCLSVRPTCRGGKVTHMNAVWFANVRFAVQPAGRAKVLREGKKNVHAFVRGYMRDFERLGSATPMHAATLIEDMEKVTYNPHLHETFVYKSDEKPIYKAAAAVVVGKDIYVPRRMSRKD